MNRLDDLAQKDSQLAPAMAQPEWLLSPAPIPYAEALACMEARAAAIAAGHAPELLWLLEHPPVITAGTSADARDLLDPAGIEVVPTGRGGRFTWHGPGQRVVYVMLDLARRGRDVHRLVAAIEDWVIAALGDLGVAGHRSARGTGVWLASTDPAGEAKVAAIGLRVRRWVSFHGVAINVDPDLGGYAGFIPCGITDARPARLADLDPDIRMAALDAALSTRIGHLLDGLRPRGLEAGSNRG
jgi:lipoyl(octanoyl) transferase